MSPPDPNSVTRLLLDWRAGDEQALEDLMPLVYEELRRLAARHMRAERQGHTLQTTALVHEAYLRLAGMEVEWEGRVHFMALAATMMRRILVDHARSRRREKRGGGVAPVPLEEALHVSASEPLGDVVELDAALERLAAIDPRKARVIELHYFGGLTYDETARALEISPATVDRDLRMGRAWLFRELNPEDPTSSV
jgi:RNA polymerase sigma factor (TIGR02999 family)